MHRHPASRASIAGRKPAAPVHSIASGDGATPILTLLAAGLAATGRTIALWHRRARGRAQLRSLERWQLDDIGLSPKQRDREARKPFWSR